MKSLIYIIFFSYLSGTINAQIIPVFPTKKDTAKASPQKPKSNSSERPDNTAIIKFLCDVDGNLFINGESRGYLPKNIPLRIKLARGEYSIRTVSLNNPNIAIGWNYFVREAGMEKLEKITLQPSIDQWLRTGQKKNQGIEQKRNEPEKAPPGAYIFFDKFVNNDNEWALLSDEKKEMTIENGRFKITGKMDKFSYSSVRNLDVDMSKNFSCLVVAKWMEGVDNSGFGLSYLSDISSHSYYTFYISSNGMYMIGYIKNNGSWNDLIKWTSSSYINQGSISNILLIKKEDNYLNFYINNHKVETMPYDGGFGKAFGLRVGGRQTVEFDDFEVKNINTETDETAFTYYDDFSDNITGWALANDDESENKIANGKFLKKGISAQSSYPTTKYFNIDLKRILVFPPRESGLKGYRLAVSV